MRPTDYILEGLYAFSNFIIFFLAKEIWWVKNEHSFILKYGNPVKLKRNFGMAYERELKTSGLVLTSAIWNVHRLTHFF